MAFSHQSTAHRKASIYVAETNARADFTSTMLDFLSDTILVPRHLYLVSSHRALKFTKWETREKKPASLAVDLGITNLCPTSGCREALQVKTRGVIHHRISSQALSVLVLLGPFAEVFKKKDQWLRVSCPAPKSCSSPGHPFWGELTHPLPLWLPGH